jgi:hypothetical protein
MHTNEYEKIIIQSRQSSKNFMSEKLTMYFRVGNYQWLRQPPWRISAA